MRARPGGRCYRQRLGGTGVTALAVAALAGAGAVAGTGAGAGCGRREPAVLELWIGGDVHLGAGSPGVLEEIRPLVEGTAGIVNLEGPVGDRPETSDARRLVNGAAALAALAAAGVRVAGIANNHAGDAGPDGPAATARALGAHGVAAAGGPAGAARIATPLLSVAVTAHDLGIAAPAALAAELATARGSADVLVTLFHVTGPPSYLPTAVLRHAVEVALEAGAAVVAAQGTHVLGPVERRGGAVVVWGLGNLVFGCACTIEREGAILRVTVGRGGAGSARVFPLDAGLGGAPARPAADASLAFDLLEAIGSTPLRREGSAASF